MSLTSDGGARDIWLFDVTRGTPTKFTFGVGDKNAAVFSLDGQHVIFSSNANHHYDLFEKATTAAAGERSLLVDTRDKSVLSWSRDGRFLLFGTSGSASGNDVWVLPLGAGGTPEKPFPFLQTPFTEGQAQFSPDGQWVVYASNESGAFQVFVTRFPEPSGKRLVSQRTGIYPRWRSDGKEIFYLDPASNKLMAATVAIKADDLEISDVQPLFDIQLTGARRYPYDITPDGQRFLVNVPDRPANATTMTMVVNWPALVR